MTNHDELDRQILAELADHGDGDEQRRPHVSIYAPMIKAGQETRQNPIRFKNLLREARQQLEQGALSAREADELLQPLEARLDDFEFWQHQDVGLAMFVADDFAMSLRLPLEFGELCVVTERFHLKPLFQWLSGDGHFHVLALSQNAVRLLDCSRNAVREIEIPGEVPTSLTDALGHELTEQHLQLRTTSRNEAIYHAQGGGEDDEKNEIRKFLAMVDDGVLNVVSTNDGSRPPPLVLAAVEELAAMYRDKSGHKELLESIVAGNPEHRSADDLHEAAWSLLAPHFDQVRQASLERFGQAMADDKASTDIDDIVIAAEEGRVDTLFVARGVRHWGRVDQTARQVVEEDEQTAGSEDLLDRAAVSTWRNGGEVYVTDPSSVPQEQSLAAIYRF